MKDESLDDFKRMFQDDCGFGDPDARTNAQMRLQLLLARQQTKILTSQNWLTLGLVVVGLLQAVIIGYQVFFMRPF